MFFEGFSHPFYKSQHSPHSSVDTAGRSQDLQRVEWISDIQQEGDTSTMSLVFATRRFVS